MLVAAPLIVLFDIDHTLIDYPLNEQTVAGALDEATGVPGLLGQLDWQGATDRWVAGEGARLTGADPRQVYSRFADAYTRILSEALASLPPTALPGAAALLDRLAVEQGVTLGICTGNTRRNAILKLEHAGLAAYFQPLRGGFGDTFDDRADIVRAASQDCGRQPGDRVVVVGDTQRDIEAARSADAFAVGVATGSSSLSALSSAGAHAVLPDLADRDACLAAIIDR